MLQAPRPCTRPQPCALWSDSLASLLICLPIHLQTSRQQSLCLCGSARAQSPAHRERRAGRHRMNEKSSESGRPPLRTTHFHVARILSAASPSTPPQSNRLPVTQPCGQHFYKATHPTAPRTQHVTTWSNTHSGRPGPEPTLSPRDRCSSCCSRPADQWDARDSQPELECHLGPEHLSLQASSSGSSVERRTMGLCLPRRLSAQLPGENGPFGAPRAAVGGRGSPGLLERREEVWPLLCDLRHVTAPFQFHRPPTPFVERKEQERTPGEHLGTDGEARPREGQCLPVTVRQHSHH